MIPLIREGSDAVDELRQKARDLGVVMDEDLIQRAAAAQLEFETLSQVIDIQLKSAFVDLGPVLVDTLRLVADLARALNSLADAWRSFDQKTDAALAGQSVALQNKLTNNRERRARGEWLVPSERSDAFVQEQLDAVNAQIGPWSTSAIPAA